MSTPTNDGKSKYNVVYWNFSPSYDDYLLEDKDSTTERMSGRDFTRGYTDDEYFSGGPCPSCRLAINKETGRLKWCMGGNDTWRLRVKLMIFIPVLLLPITIVFIALSRSPVVGRSFNHHRTYLVYSGPRIEDDKEEIITPTTRTDVDRTNVAEEDDRNFLSDIKTSYVPTDTQIPIRSSERRKREATGEHHQQSRNRRISRNSNRFVASTVIARPHLQESRKEETQVEEGADEAGTPSNEVGNFLLDPYYEVGEDYGNGEKEVDDYPEADEAAFSVKNGDESDSMDDRFDYEEDYGREEHLQNDSDEDERFSSVEVEDSEDDESGEGEHADINASVGSSHSYSDGIPDFHAFWKNEGTMRNIREAQAKMMLKYMDKTVDPCQDFYQYACGNWAKLNPIPKDKAGYDTFEMLRESLDSVLRELLEEPIAIDAGPNSEDATIKAKRLFQSCMNYEILEQRMERPLLQLLDELGGWPIIKPDWSPENFDWLLLVAQLRLYNNDILISEWVGPDIKNSDQYIIQFDQTSLGLPTRDYFLQPSNARYLEAYRKYLIKIATLLGASSRTAKIQANELIDFETRLAKITSSPDERRNVSELYRKMTVGVLGIIIPEINWHRYLSIVLARPVSSSEPVVVFAIQYIQDLVRLLSQTPPRIVSNYLLWRFVRHRVNNLDDRFQEAKQRFYYILFGREQAPSRWKTCVAQVNSNMGMAVGSMFVRKYFDENSKNDTLSMTRDIQRSFKELLDGTRWIDNETKQIASEKADAMLLRIGYPDFILQQQLLDERYIDVVVQPDKYFENTLNILQHLTRVEQDRLGSPVNKSLWNTAPAVVNAYYSRNKNQIMFPAGILQPPFYHRHFPRSLNYGGIGVVIGHEITHGFDDKGRLFDKDGNLHRWWKNEAIDGFHERAQCLIDQYSRYVVNEVGMQIDGVNTQGENIADNGGIKQAFRAYEKWLRANGDADETLPGMNSTGKQLFFLNFAQVWCGSMRPEAMKNKLKTAVHSPGKYRVIGTLSNSKDFAEVFDCPAGSPMNPFYKCSVW